MTILPRWRSCWALSLTLVVACLLLAVVCLNILDLGRSVTSILTMDTLCSLAIYRCRPSLLLVQRRQLLPLLLQMHVLLQLHNPTAVSTCRSCEALLELYQVRVFSQSLHVLVYTADMCIPLYSNRQFCLDQKLSICKDASIGDADPDTATGNEGDIQTRCFRGCYTYKE